MAGSDLVQVALPNIQTPPPPFLRCCCCNPLWPTRTRLLRYGKKSRFQRGKLCDCQIEIHTETCYRFASFLSYLLIRKTQHGFIFMWCCCCCCFSYLVCSMYEQAASLASSILKRLCHARQDIATHDMLESTAMVLVQALNQLGR